MVTAIPSSSLLERSVPSVIPDTEHRINRKAISRNALKVVDALNEAGHESYLVGGCVRDLLLGRTPKDFDVATAAEPEQVRELFRNSRLIGRRFRLAHVRFGREIVEVATFRASHGAQDDGDGETNVDGRIVRDNVYGTLEDDAWRRDFTMNSLYYDARDNSVIDYVGGLADTEARVLRLIGDPETRYREDPVRMLRAVRFAAKLECNIEESTEEPLLDFAYLLGEVPPARLFDETLKLFLTGHAERSFDWLLKYDLFDELFPESARYIEAPGAAPFLRQALINTDQRIAEDKPVTPGFLFAAFLWWPMRRLAEDFRVAGKSGYESVDMAASDVIRTQNERIAFPRRFSLMAKDIWALQPRLEQRKGRRTNQLLERPRFRAAYDFLALRSQAGEDGLKGMVDFWTKAQTQGGDSAANGATRPAPNGNKPRRRRRRRRKAAEA